MAAEFKVAAAYATFRIDVDKGIDEAKARIKQRARDLDTSARIKLDVDVKDAKASLRKEFADERFTVKADADTTLARARLEKLTGEGTFKIKPDVDVPASRRAEQQLDGTVSRMAQRANDKFDLLKFTAFTVGLPAAAAAGTGLAVGAIGAIPIAFGAATVALLAGTDAFSAKWSGLAGRVSDDAHAMAGALEGEVLGAIDTLGAGWDRIKPKIASALLAAAPGIDTMVTGMDRLAENAMPGVIRAAQRSGDAMTGLGTLMAQTGAGVSDLFTNLSTGSTAAGQSTVILGGTIQTLLGRVGQLGANLATTAQGPLRSLDVMVDQLTGSLVDATAQGSGVIGFLQGFSTAGSGLFTVLHGVVAAASLLPPGMTQIGGSVAATGMILNKFGIDATAGFDGLGKKISETKGFTGKLSAGLTGLAEGALNPAALAAVGLGLVLNEVGKAQEDASRYAASHRDNIRQLTEAIREDNGVLGEHVAKVNAQALESKNAAANLSVYGGSMKDAALAISGNADAYDRLNYASRAQADQIGKNAQLNDADRASLKNLATQALETGMSYAELGRANGETTRQADRLGGVWNSQLQAIANANGAIGAQINEQKKAMEAYYASEGALTGLSEAQIKARDATVAHTAATQEAVGGELGYRGAVQGTKAAIDEYNKTNKDGKASEDQKAAALLGAENAMYRQVQAAGQAAAANRNLKTDNDRAAASAAAMNRETVNLANTWVGPLPASLQSGIAKMSVAEAKAAGLTVAIDGTGNAVYRLPNGKTIRIESNADQQAAKVEALRASIAALHDREVKITVDTFYGTSGRGQSLTGVPVARSQGGLVGRLAAASGRAYAGGADAVAPLNGGVVGRALGRSIRDVLPALLAPGEAVTNSADTARNYRELQAINNGQRNYERYPDTGRPPERTSLPVQRAASPEPTVINVYPPADIDVYALARMVSREMELSGKVSG